MPSSQSLHRKAHFLGTKIRRLRKRNNLTLEDLSVRCIQLDRENGPSVSYLSMIENGKRVPSQELMQLIADIFQKDIDWFFDESVEDIEIEPEPEAGGISGMPLEPGFLFSSELLQTAIPELLAQTGTTGRQFAHLLIRAHQEANQNHHRPINYGQGQRILISSRLPAKTIHVHEQNAEQGKTAQDVNEFDALFGLNGSGS